MKYSKLTTQMLNDVLRAYEQMQDNRMLSAKNIGSSTLPNGKKVRLLLVDEQAFKIFTQAMFDNGKMLKPIPNKE